MHKARTVSSDGYMHGASAIEDRLNDNECMHLGITGAKDLNKDDKITRVDLSV